MRSHNSTESEKYTVCVCDVGWIQCVSDARVASSAPVLHPPTFAASHFVALGLAALRRESGKCTYEQKHKWSAYHMSSFFGLFGADWFYLARGGTGVVSRPFSPVLSFAFLSHPVERRGRVGWQKRSVGEEGRKDE